MGIFDRIRSAIGGGSDTDPMDPLDTAGEGRPGVDRGAGTDRVGVDPDDDRKTGSHGSHWDAIAERNSQVREATVAAVREGRSIEGRSVDGTSVVGHDYPDAPLRTRAVSIDGTVATTFPVGTGIAHRVTIEEVIEWANDVEAQVAFELAGKRLAAFDAGYFARESDYEAGETREFELSAFAYDLDPAEAGALADDEAGDGTVTDDEQPVQSPDLATYLPFEGGDVDDYVFQSPVSEVRELSFGSVTVYRLRLPLFRDDHDRNVDVAVYAAEHMTGGYRPREGDAVEGVIWLQCRESDHQTS